MFIEAQRKFEISSAVLYLDPQKSSMTMVRSHIFGMGKLLWGLGAQPLALKNFAFFCKNYLILGLKLLKRGTEIGSADMIKLIA